MSTNYRGYSIDGAHPKALKVEDLTVGQLLIRADWNYYNGQNPQITETTWSVTKILKSRLVLTRVREHDGVEITVRVLVTNNKSYTYRNGEVEAVLEGQGGSWNSKSFYLFTVDEPKLISIRAEIAEAKIKADAKRTATEALEAFKRSMSVEQAEFTIAALQAYIETRKDSE